MRIEVPNFLIIFVLCLVLLLSAIPTLSAETFSGHVLDEAGKPIAGITVALRELNSDTVESSITDDDGRFSISSTNVPVELMLYPKTNAPYTISMVHIAGMIYYPGQHVNLPENIVFTFVEGANIKDVQINVRKRTLIRGRVLKQDGTPLNNVNALLNLSGQALNGTSPIIRGMLTQLDQDGYFELYVDSPGYYTFSLEYQKEIARTDEILITGKPDDDKLVLMLGGKTETNLSEDLGDRQQQTQKLKRNIDQFNPIPTSSSKEKATFSGRVVDTNGNAISGFKLGLQPMQYYGGMFRKERMRFIKTNDHLSDETVPIKKETPNESVIEDDTLPPRNQLVSPITASGTFSFNQIEAGPLQLFILSEDTTSNKGKIGTGIHGQEHLESEFEILSVKFGPMIFGNFEELPFLLFNQITFGITPGATIENVEITVKRRIKVSGRVIYADGTPLKDLITKLRIKEPQHGIPSLGDADGYTSQANIRTDTYGFFNIFVENPGDYFFHVKYIVLTAEAGPITIKDSVQQNELILKLNGNILFPDSLIDNMATNDDEQLPDVWVVNPANGHSYKVVECEDWYDAHLKATQNGAHLVSINDEVEHKWITEIFGSGFFWIGLNDLEKEGEWLWDSGEPLTYKLWETDELFPEGTLSDVEKDYAVMNINGKWQATGPQTTVWIMTRQAILENDGLLSTIQPKSEPVEK